jgi:hypothetical protein
MSNQWLEDIDKRRQESIEHMITPLHYLLHSLRTGPESCSFECDSIVLGALTKGLEARNLFTTPPVPPFSGLTFASTAESLTTIRSPNWRDSYRKEHRQCSLKSRIDTIVDSLKQKKGLSLDNYYEYGAPNKR